MAAKRLTEIGVENLKAPKSGQQDHWDRIVPRFGLRVSFSGRKSWVITTRLLKNGEWQPATRITIGTYPVMKLEAARERGRAWLAAAHEGRDPRDLAKIEEAAKKRDSRNSFGAVADTFLKKYPPTRKGGGLRGSTVVQYERALKGAAVSEWRDRPLVSITRQDIRDKLNDLVDGGTPVEANRRLAYWRVFFAWCVDQGLIEFSPVEGVKRPSGEQSRDRVLSTSELGEVWAACDEEGGIFGPLVKLLILCGQRRDEVAGMNDAELRNAPTWELPGERTKNRLPHLVPLSSQAHDIIRTVPRLAGSRLVFSTNGETRVSGFGKVKRRIDEHIATARKRARIKEAMAPWRLHDIRRSVATGMADIGVQPHVIEAVLNHISGYRAGIAGVYNRAEYLSEKRAALQAWADHIAPQ